MPFNYSYILLFLIACLVNIPMGYIREGCAKFSLPWFFWIHASIPLLIYLRLKWGISVWFIPFSIFFAVIGQILGSRIKRKYVTREEIEKLQQIPDLNISTDKPAVDEKDVMVVLLNMGGPKTNDDVADFQRRLFSDSILIRFPLSFLLQKIFAWILVKVRLKISKARYQLIGGGSPIYASTQAQTQALRQELQRRGRKVDVTFSFNYSPPLPEETLQEVKAKGKKYILPLSLYPHYSKATTGSNLHYLKLAAQEIYPQVKFLPTPSYYLHDGYIQAFVDRLNEAIKPGEFLEDFYILFSAHGLPIYSLMEGDPYPYQINQTVSKILNQIQRTKNWSLCYQSAVGPLQWLKPATEDTLKALAVRGIKKILVVPVAFVGDHIESLCEIDIEYRHVAKKLGIEDFRMTKAIEAHPQFIEALADSVEEEIKTKKLETRKEKTVCH